MNELEFLKAENKELKERLLQAAKENNRMNMRLQQVLATITNAAAAIASEYADFTAVVFADTEKLEAELGVENKLVTHTEPESGDEVLDLEHTDQPLSVTTQDTELAHALEYRREKHEEDCADYVNRRYALLMSALDIPELEARRMAKERYLKEHPVPTVQQVADEIVPSFKPYDYALATGRTLTSSEAAKVADPAPLFEPLKPKAEVLLNGISCTLSTKIAPDVKIVFDKTNSLLVMQGTSERIAIVVNKDKGFDVNNKESVTHDFLTDTVKPVTDRSLGEMLNLKYIIEDMSIVTD
nr:MAG TPA: hypothetical protein [Caudoviricetes sp.]